MDLSEIERRGVENIITNRRLQLNIEDANELSLWTEADWEILNIDNKDYFSRNRQLGTTHQIPYATRFRDYKISSTPDEGRVSIADYTRSWAADDFMDMFVSLFGHSKSVKLIITSTNYLKVAHAITALFPLRSELDIQLAIYVMNSDYSPNDQRYIDGRKTQIRLVPGRFRRYSSGSEESEENQEPYQDNTNIGWGPVFSVVSATRRLSRRLSSIVDQMPE